MIASHNILLEEDGGFMQFDGIVIVFPVVMMEAEIGGVVCVPSSATDAEENRQLESAGRPVWWDPGFLIHCEG